MQYPLVIMCKMLNDSNRFALCTLYISYQSVIPTVEVCVSEKMHCT